MRISDWSSDVCSSDLPPGRGRRRGLSAEVRDGGADLVRAGAQREGDDDGIGAAEERGNGPRRRCIFWLHFFHGNELVRHLNVANRVPRHRPACEIPQGDPVAVDGQPWFGQRYFAQQPEGKERGSSQEEGLRELTSVVGE